MSGGNPLPPRYAWALLYHQELVNFLPKILPIESLPQQLPPLSPTPPMLIKLKKFQASCPGLHKKVLVDGKREGWLSYNDLLQNNSEEFDAVLTRANEESMCYFTSGTTGLPKMTIHRHDYGIAHQVTGKYWLNLNKNDLHWNISDTGGAKAAWSSY
ncbi:MAG: hypothetical protein Ct9H90mP25_0890 [Gammaproteobacteria bacterium]|nr:MAG: hypothetical protein Ct9H90mP25_0890 [Gammaproteobacteria bacterium]